MNIHEIADLIASDMADKIIKEHSSIIPGGNNGPYYNEETNVRNLAHWCVIFASRCKKTSDERYKAALKITADAILNSEHYNGKGVYRCRYTKVADEVNGTIGPAWIIEGLIYAARVLEDNRYYDRAVEIFSVIPFNSSLGIWNRINTQNKVLSVDTTFNHQLWLAAAGAMICSYKNVPEIEKQLRRFCDRLPVLMTIRRDGRIAHFTLNDQNGILGYPGRIYRDLKSDIAELLGRPSFAYKEAGYHAFNLYGFAILKENAGFDIPFLASAKFQKCIDYVKTKKYYESLLKADRNLDVTKVPTKLKVDFNVFSFAYNSSAFELPRVLKCFGTEAEEAKKICAPFMEAQIKLTYDNDEKAFSKNTDDPFVLTTRIYELLAD